MGETGAQRFSPCSIISFRLFYHSSRGRVRGFPRFGFMTAQGRIPPSAVPLGPSTGEEGRKGPPCARRLYCSELTGLARVLNSLPGFLMLLGWHLGHICRTYVRREIYFLRRQRQAARRRECPRPKPVTPSDRTSPDSAHSAVAWLWRFVLSILRVPAYVSSSLG